MRRMVRLKSSHRITSIADFISARYAKSEALAASVTLVALVGTVPYVALQLKSGGFHLHGDNQPGHRTADGLGRHAHVGPVVVGMMILFHHHVRGAAAGPPPSATRAWSWPWRAESLVKLVAFVAGGVFVAYLACMDGFEWPISSIRRARRPGWWAALEPAAWGAIPLLSLPGSAYLIVVSANAILCLPRQFHISVVGEPKREIISNGPWWLFPLYLLVINLFVFPVALAGAPGKDIPFPPGRHLSCLSCPWTRENTGFWPCSYFIGGFSAATSMILISSMTLATMISNHLLLAPGGLDTSASDHRAQSLAMPLALGGRLHPFGLLVRVPCGRAVAPFEHRHALLRGGSAAGPAPWWAACSGGGARCAGPCWVWWPVFACGPTPCFYPPSCTAAGYPWTCWTMGPGGSVS